MGVHEDPLGGPPTHRWLALGQEWQDPICHFPAHVLESSMSWRLQGQVLETYHSGAWVEGPNCGYIPAFFKLTNQPHCKAFP